MEVYTIKDEWYMPFLYCDIDKYLQQMRLQPVSMCWSPNLTSLALCQLELKQARLRAAHSLRLVAILLVECVTAVVECLDEMLTSTLIVGVLVQTICALVPRVTR